MIKFHIPIEILLILDDIKTECEIGFLEWKHACPDTHTDMI